MLYFLDTWISPRWDTKTVIEQEASNIFYEAIISSIKKKKMIERERERKEGKKEGRGDRLPRLRAGLLVEPSSPRVETSPHSDEPGDEG